MFWTKRTARKIISPTIRAALTETFNDHELGELARLGTLIDVPAGQKLTVEGTAGREVLIIVDGTASVRRSDTTIATVSRGDVIGEMAVMSGEPRMATVVADTDMSVYAMSSREFATLLARCPRIETNVTKTAMRRLAATY